MTCHLQINQLGFQLDLKKKDAFKTNIKQHKTQTIITRFKGTHYTTIKSPRTHYTITSRKTTTPSRAEKPTTPSRAQEPTTPSQAQVAATPPPSGAQVPTTLPSTAQVSPVGPTSQGKQR